MEKLIAILARGLFETTIHSNQPGGQTVGQRKARAEQAICILQSAITLLKCFTAPGRSHATDPAPFVSMDDIMRALRNPAMVMAEPEPLRIPTLRPARQADPINLDQLHSDALRSVIHEALSAIRTELDQHAGRLDTVERQQREIAQFQAERTETLASIQDRLTRASEALDGI